MTERLQAPYLEQVPRPEADAFQAYTLPDDAHTLPDDLPEESAAAIAASMVKVAREVAGVDIGVTREIIPCRTVNISAFVVSLPAGLAEGPRAELDYWLREVGGILRYAGE